MGDKYELKLIKEVRGDMVVARCHFVWLPIKKSINTMYI